MLKSAGRRLWVCTQCSSRRGVIKQIQQIQQQARQIRPINQQRWTSSGRPEARENDSLPADNSASTRHDDAVLRELFDAPSSGTSSKFGVGGRSQGLFKNRYLTSPEGFLVFAQKNIEKATRIVERVLAASTIDQYRALVRDLDRLSDLLCRVLDMSDFVRMTHPDARFQQAAADAWSMVYEYMNQLNTMTGLSDQLGEALSRPQVTTAWSEEEKIVAELLKLDFLKSAVNLPKESRDRFVQLSSLISHVGSAFVQGMEPEVREITLPAASFYGLYPGLAARLKVRSRISMPTTGPEAAAALQSVQDEDIRRQIFLAQRTASRDTISRLETMLKLRAELAQLAGFESHGHMALKDRMMAKSPASVMEFLLALRKHNTPIIQQELRELALKKQDMLASSGSGSGSGSRSSSSSSSGPDAATDAALQSWDKDYYMEKMRSDMRSRVRHEDHLMAYFSVGTVMQGLSRLFDSLYGIRLVPRETLPGETWHPDVKRLDVVASDGEKVAVLYCDLFFRPQKSPNPAHFTVRCSREIPPAEIHEAAAEVAAAFSDSSSSSYSSSPSSWPWSSPDNNGSSTHPTFESAEQAANDGMETTSAGGRLMQLPTVALVCDFPKSDTSSSSSSSSTREPALLSLYSVETLFHEMGHAIHSILARTSFQNVSGTRCATDFAELPSTLMEHFASDPSVLALFARHWRSDAPLPHGLVAHRVRLARRFEGCDTEYQILLAMLDQAYHSPAALDPAFDSTAIFHDLQHRYSHGPRDPTGTRWQGFFGHLHSYGSTYYSYLFDRVLAERVWRVVFRAGADGAAITRENGEHLKENLLKWGGSRDPWTCLADTLRDDRLAAGDDKAMALVGSWGIKDASRHS